MDITTPQKTRIAWEICETLILVTTSSESSKQKVACCKTLLSGSWRMTTSSGGETKAKAGCSGSEAIPAKGRRCCSVGSSTSCRCAELQTQPTSSARPQTLASTTLQPYYAVSSICSSINRSRSCLMFGRGTTREAKGCLRMRTLGSP